MGGLFGTALLAGIVLALTSSNVRAVRLRAKTKADLERTKGTLFESDRRFREVVDAAGDFVWELDRAGRLTYLTEGVEAVLGRSAKDMLGKPFGELAPPPDSDPERCLTEALESAAPAGVVEWPTRRRDGGPISLSITGRPVLGPAQDTIGYRGICHEITARKQAEETSRLATEKFRALVEQPLVGIYVLQKDIFSYANPRFLEMTGYTAEELPRTPAERFVAEEDRAMVAENIRRRIEGQVEALRYEFRLLRKDGRSVRVEVHGRRVEFEGEPAILGLVLPADERILLAEEREKAEAAAEAAHRVKAEFLANVSHELLTPLNGVLGMTRMLLESELGREQRDWALTVQDSADTLLRLVSEILEYTRGEDDGLPEAHEGFSLRQVLSAALEHIGPAAQGKGLALRCAVEESIPDAFSGDLPKIREILRILTGNAVKFTEHGEITLSASLIERTEAGARLRFAVEDTGIGIAPEHQERVFETFTQVDGSSTRPFDGAGLGLALCQKLAGRLGGGMELRSEPGRGSEFRCEIPLRLASADAAESGAGRVDTVETAGGEAEPTESVTRTVDAVKGATEEQATEEQATEEQATEEPAAGEPAAEAPATGEPAAGEPAAPALPDQAAVSSPVTEAAPADPGENRAVSPEASAETIEAPPAPAGALAGLRILVAEDSLVNRKVVMRVLEKLQCRANAVSNGREALKAVESAEYDLILMDVQMPVMDGLQTTREIRAREAAGARRVPIVALTAHASNEEKDRCLAAGMDDFLTKPLEVAALKTTMRKLMEADLGSRQAA